MLEVVLWAGTYKPVSLELVRLATWTVMVELFGICLDGYVSLRSSVLLMFFAGYNGGHRRARAGTTNRQIKPVGKIDLSRQLSPHLDDWPEQWTNGGYTRNLLHEMSILRKHSNLPPSHLL